MLTTSQNEVGQSRLFSTSGTLFLCVFTKHVKTLQVRIKKSGILLRQCLALFFLVAANTTSFNLSKFDTTDLKAQNKYIGAIS